MPAANDYTTEELAQIMSVSIFTARKVRTGRYKVGVRVRFCREEIDFCRKTGKKIEVLH